MAGIAGRTPEILQRWKENKLMMSINSIMVWEVNR